jgi:hypothetical protein
MSDRFDVAFEVLRGQRPPAPFAPAEAVRRRGRQRTIRQGLVVVAAVLAVSGVGAGWAVGRSEGGPSPVPPASSHSPTVTPSRPPGPPAPSGSAGIGTPSPTGTGLAGGFLRPADLGTGSWQPVSGAEPFESADRWYWANLCPAYRSADYPSLRAQLNVNTTGYRDGARFVHEHVHRYAAGKGGTALDDVRRVVTKCAGPGAPPTSPRPDGTIPGRYTVLDSGFAGDGALLVREERWGYDAGGKIAEKPYTRLIAVVRVGDLVATVLLSPERDGAAAHTLATIAADRLRKG